MRLFPGCSLVYEHEDVAGGLVLLYRGREGKVDVQLNKLQVLLTAVKFDPDQVHKHYLTRFNSHEKRLVLCTNFEQSLLCPKGSKATPRHS
jgi:hypothetical protein